MTDANPEPSRSATRRTLLTGFAGLVTGGVAAAALGAAEPADAAASASTKAGSTATAKAIATLTTKVAASYVSGFDVSRFVKGDGKKDDTAGLRKAIDAAVLKKARVIVIPPGKRLLLTAPVDLKGVSVIGYGATVLASRKTKPAKWRIRGSKYANDVAVLYAIGHSSWTVAGLTIDCQDAFCKGLTAWGGDHITYLHVTVLNSASAALHMMGSERAGVDVPIRFGRMIACTVDRGRWSFTLDGAHVGTEIVGCTSTNCLASHISVDPGAAGRAADKKATGLVIVGNTMTGAIANPANWHTTGGASVNEAGIRLVGGNISATVTGNHVRNWPTIGIEAQGVGGTIVGNTIVNEPDYRTGGTGIALRGNTALTLGPNQITNHAQGVSIDAAVTDTRVLPHGFSAVATRYVLPEALQPSVQIDDAAYLAPGGVFSAEPAAAKASRALSPQAVATDAATVLVFDARPYDDFGGIDLAGAPDRVSVRTAGRYHLDATVTFAANGTGYRELRLVDAASGALLGRAQSAALAGVSTTVSLAADAVVAGSPLAVQLQIFHNAGVELDVAVDELAASLLVRKSA